MPKKRHGVAQIIPKLRQADVELGKGKKVSRGGRMTRLAYFARCGLWPGNGHGSEPSVFTICW